MHTYLERMRGMCTVRIRIERYGSPIIQSVARALCNHGLPRCVVWFATRILYPPRSVPPPTDDHDSPTIHATPHEKPDVTQLMQNHLQRGA